MPTCVRVVPHEPLAPLWVARLCRAKYCTVTVVPCAPWLQAASGCSCCCMHTPMVRTAPAHRANIIHLPLLVTRCRGGGLHSTGGKHPAYDSNWCALTVADAQPTQVQTRTAVSGHRLCGPHAACCSYPLRKLHVLDLRIVPSPRTFESSMGRGVRAALAGLLDLKTVPSRTLGSSANAAAFSVSLQALTAF